MFVTRRMRQDSPQVSGHAAVNQNQPRGQSPSRSSSRKRASFPSLFRRFSEVSLWIKSHQRAQGQGLSQQGSLPAASSQVVNLDAASEDGNMDASHVCPLCLEPVEDPSSLVTLPCGHSFHKSPTTVASDSLVQLDRCGHLGICPILRREHSLQLPKFVVHNSRTMKRVPVEKVSYGSTMNCDLCSCIVPNVPGNQVFHSSTPMPGDLGGYDMCVQCYLDTVHTSNSCRGVEHWLAHNASCPVCRAPVPANFGTNKDSLPDTDSRPSQIDRGEHATSQENPDGGWWPLWWLIPLLEAFIDED